MKPSVLWRAGILIVAATIVLSACGSLAGPTKQGIGGAVWVADEEGNSITVINAATNQVITTLNGIEGPHNLQVAPDGETVWAVSGHEALAVMIDAHNYKIHGVVPTGMEPAHIVLSPDGKTAYATDGGDNTVTVIDVDSMTDVATIPVGEYPHGLRPSPDGRWVYVANAKSNTLSVIDAQTNTKVADIEVGERPVQVGFSPDAKYVYFSLNGENALGKVDIATRTLMGKATVGGGPIQVFVTPDNKYILVANQGTKENPSTTVSIVDTNPFKVVSTIQTGKGAHGVVIDPSGRYAYITNIYENTVSVIDIEQRTVISTIPSGAAPNGISFSALPANPAPSAEVQLEIPERDMMDMPGMTP